MTEPTHAHRREAARQLALSADYLFRYWCKALDIDPEAVTGSPLLVIAERQAQARRARKTDFR